MAAMTTHDLLALLAGDDIPALVTAIRVDLGYTDADSSKALGYAGEWSGVVSDVEAGRAPVAPFDAGYVARGMVATWMIRRGGWTPREGVYHHESGAKILGNGTGSWAMVPGFRGLIEERMGPAGCEGPGGVRHDVLRLMLRLMAGERPR